MSSITDLIREQITQQQELQVHSGTITRSDVVGIYVHLEDEGNAGPFTDYLAVGNPAVGDSCVVLDTAQGDRMVVVLNRGNVLGGGISTVRHGNGPPLDSEGNDGDFYIDVVANTIYGPKEGAWGAATALRGPQGPQPDLAALLVNQDKIVWVNDDGDVIEVWGEQIDAGLLVDHVDHFTEDSRALYAPTVAGGETLVDVGYDNTNGWIDTTGGTAYHATAYRPDWGTYPDTAKVTLRANLVSVSPNERVGWFDNIGGSSMYLEMGAGGVLSWSEGSMYRRYDLVGAVNGWCLYEITRNGNLVHIKVTQESTSAVLYEGDITLDPANRPALGAGQLLHPWFEAHAFNSNVYIDDFTVYSVQPERRRLRAAITPGLGGGPRTEFTLLGYAGASPESAFAFTDDPRLSDARAAIPFLFTQTAPLASWVVVHNLGLYPSVEVVDSGGTTIDPDIHYDSLDQLTITFGSATSGKAYLN